MSEKIGWRCPSNIALVKYWGKKEVQIPCNASLSMTLSNACTEVVLSLSDKKQEGLELEYYFEGAKNDSFGRRVGDYITAQQKHFPVIRDRALRIDSKNSFPHSTGIASSASAFGAIALALLSASGYAGDDFLNKASFLARLGSGSACRSMFGAYAMWGQLPHVAASSDEYATPVAQVHSNFADMRDAILIVDDTPKRVSSSAGHKLMDGHFYAESRFRQANLHCTDMLRVLQSGDYEEFVRIIEREALALHAMMMTSGNYYLLMKPGTVHALEEIMDFRRDTKIPVCFTLDAGPNVHVIYPAKDEEEVRSFLETRLNPIAKSILFDRIGIGPEKIMC